MRQIGFRLPEMLEARFEAFAARYGSRSAAMRALVEHGLDGAPEAAPAAVSHESVAPASRKITLVIEGAELERLEEEAAAMGMGCAEWVRSCVRSRLTGQRQLNKVERGYLRQALQELRSMREHLSRMRNSLQRAVLLGREVEGSLSAIGGLDEKLAEAIAAVRLGFLGNDHYWSAEAREKADGLEPPSPERLRGVGAGRAG